MRPTRGFFLLDGMAGLAVLGVLTAVLALTAGQRARLTARLADTRAATQLAETALLDLQQGRRTAASVVVRDSQPLTDTLQWTTVQATVNGRTVTLTGATRRQP